MSFGLFLTSLLATGGGGSCTTISGFELLVTKPTYRWLIVGELHGTSEIPVAFSNLICLLAEKDHSIVVGLEYPATEQVRIDAYLASSGDAPARRLLLQSPIWQAKVQDGRTSIALLELIERLRQLKAAHRIEGVVAFQPEWRGSAAAYEEDMAKILDSAAVRAPGKLIVALVGNAHAAKGQQEGAGQVVRPMASYLPSDETVTLNVVPNGGSQWGCFFRGAPTPGALPNCGAQDFTEPATSHPAGIVLNFKGSIYNGSLYLGARTTASPPAATPETVQ